MKWCKYKLSYLEKCRLKPIEWQNATTEDVLSESSSQNRSKMNHTTFNTTYSSCGFFLSAVNPANICSDVLAVFITRIVVKRYYLSFYHVLNILVMVAVKQWRPQPASYQIQRSTRLFGLNSKRHFTSQRRHHVLYYDWPSTKHCLIDMFTGFIIWFWWALSGVMLQWNTCSYTRTSSLKFASPWPLFWWSWGLQPLSFPAKAFRPQHDYLSKVRKTRRQTTQNLIIFAVFFSTGWQRNVQRFITGMHSYYFYSFNLLFFEVLVALVCYSARKLLEYYTQSIL